MDLKVYKDLKHTIRIRMDRTTRLIWICFRIEVDYAYDILCTCPVSYYLRHISYFPVDKALTDTLSREKTSNSEAQSDIIKVYITVHIITVIVSSLAIFSSMPSVYKFNVFQNCVKDRLGTS